MSLRARQRIGKYRLERRLAEGGFAAVYSAWDTVEGVRVALKVPLAATSQALEEIRREVRLMAGLDHQHILPVKNAALVDGRFLIAMPLGDETLEHRLARRMSADTALDFAEQMLEALAYAHGRRIIHCDVKPDNMILFGRKYLRITDFGIAKRAMRRMTASGSGTVGYMAPEQAMGHPVFASDCFSVGLILHRMLTGALPAWPYRWPLARHDRLCQRTTPALRAVLVRALSIDADQRYKNAGLMLAALRHARSGAARRLKAA
jgi:serine/threonine protein kinase